MTRYKNKLINYFKKVIVIQSLISIVLSILLFLVALYFSYSKNEISYPLISLAIAGPFICTFFLIRRFCYLLFQPGIALIGTFFYTVILSLLYYKLFRENQVDTFNIFLLFGLASLISSLVIVMLIHVRFPSLLKSVISTRVVIHKHWDLGKWLLGSSIVGWLSSSIYFPLLASLSGLEATAALKAIDNLLLPMQQVITALSLIIIPRVAGEMNKDTHYLRNVSIKLTIFFSGVVILYLIFLFLLKDNLIQILYGQNSIYIYYLWMLPFLGLTLVTRAVADLGIGVSLRIAERFDVLFKSSVANSIFTLTVGVFLIWKFGILGAGIGIAIGSVIQMIISTFYFKKIFSKRA